MGRRYPGRAVKPTVIVTHLEDRHTGLVRTCLEDAGCRVVAWDALGPAPAPSLAEISGIVSLGGRVSATEIDRHRFLAEEVELMRDALAGDVPVLGMCLGAQLLAAAAGGRVAPMRRMYVGWPELSLLPAADEDPVVAPLPTGLPVLEWHEDLIELPPGAVTLGTTPTPGAALFRIGPSAWGSQMHLELTPEMLVDTWLADPGSVVEIEAAGYEIDPFRAESRGRLVAQMAASRPLFQRFGQVVAAAQVSQASPAPRQGAPAAQGPDSQGSPPSAGRWMPIR